ncbi:hypothetical protein G6644_00665 [Polynucleobacter paneuropaeus]|nr:hypothetical protein [Polynucleobacter paneuropaeus]MBT8637573.1 hypothetical protein [Polynucleobacter paneuropaeus]
MSDIYVNDMDWSKNGNGFSSFNNYRRYQFNLISKYIGSRILEIGTASFIIIIINISILKIKKIPPINKNYCQIFFILLFSYYAVGIIYIALNMGGFYEYILSNNKFNNVTLDLQNIALMGIIPITLFTLLLRLLKPSENPTCFTLLLICLGLILGNGTSAGISEISLFLPFTFLVGALMSLPDPTRFQRLFVSYVCIMLIFSLADSKFKAPYAWWYTSEPEIYDNAYETKIPLLAGMKLSDSGAVTLNEIFDVITSHSSPSDDIFLFPNISGLYAITNRLPHSKSVVTWFDFLPDRLAKEEANRLIENPPKIIGNLQLPEKVWNVHETYFRGGQKMGQRHIQEAIKTLTSKKNSPYSLIYTKQISPESKFEVWARN